jgi:hypothetical protein
MQLRTMKLLAAQSPEEVLRAKVDVVSRAMLETDPLPRVRVFAGGHVFRGIPARIDDRRQESWLTLVDGEAVAYLSLRSVTALVVEHVTIPEPVHTTSKEKPMGLVEKRIANALQKDSFVGWQKMITDACPGTPIAIEVAWDELVKEGFAEYYPKNVEHNFFGPLAAALRSICSDDIGKQAFAAKIKKINIGSKRSWSSLQAKVEGDTLFLDADPSYAKTEDDARDYAKEIQTTLENAL